MIIDEHTKYDFQIGWLQGIIRRQGAQLGLSNQQVNDMIQQAEQEAIKFATRPRS